MGGAFEQGEMEGTILDCDWDNRPTQIAIGTIARCNTIVPIVGSAFEQAEMEGANFDCDWDNRPTQYAIGTIALRNSRLGQSPYEGKRLLEGL